MFGGRSIFRVNVREAVVNRSSNVADCIAHSTVVNRSSNVADCIAHSTVVNRSWKVADYIAWLAVERLVTGDYWNEHITPILNNVM